MKSLAACLSLCILLLAGCGNSGGATTPGGSGASATPEKSKTYEKGTLTESGFESEYLELKFTAPEGYIMAAEEEMIEMADFGAEIVYKDVDKKIVDYAMANIVYEMMTFSSEGVPNLMVMVEKIALKNMTVEQYLKNLETQLLETSEMEYTVLGTSEANVAEQSYMKLSCEIAGGVLQDYYVRKIDNRMVGIIVTYTADATADAEALLSVFTK